MDCLFCKIVAGQIKSNIIYQNDDILVFDDIRPQAPHHKLIIPKRHIPSINEVTVEDKNVLGDMILTAKQIAQDLNIANDGYRLVFNCNAHGGQEVFHIHLHLLGGRQMHWPPG